MRAVVLIAAAVVLATPAAAAAEPPPLKAALAACLTGSGAADRSAAFTGSMPGSAVDGTRRMAMRFDLQRRASPDDAYEGVRVPGLGAWLMSATGRSGFVFTQRVRRLQAPGSFRAVVRFRWLGAAGQVLRTARRTTPVCTQPDWRADLRAGALAADAPALPGSPATYRLTVSNGGRGAAGAFDVSLEAGGAAVTRREQDGLQAGGQVTLSFTAPACAPGTTVRIVLDPGGELAEAVEGDDVVLRACPLAG
jgi:hypothetical protein